MDSKEAKSLERSGKQVSARMGGAALVLVIFALALSGCFLDRSGLLLPDPDIAVEPSLVCAGEPAVVSWTVPSPGTAGCYRRIRAGEHACPTVTDVLQDGSSMGVGPSEYPGSRSVVITADTTFTINATMIRDSDGAPYMGTDSASVSVVDGAGEHDAFFDGVCGGRGSVDLSGFSTCLNIDTICMASDGSGTPGNAGASVRVYGMRNNGDGSYTENARAELTTDEPCADGSAFNDSDELRAALFNIIDFGPVLIPSDGSVECRVEWPDINLVLNLSCPADLGSCSATGMGGGGENEPPPTAVDNVSIPSSDDVCAGKGGLQYEGDTCVCSGNIDHVILCQDGTKIDTVTEKTCLPDQEACKEGGGSNTSGGSQQCEDKSCGNQSCQPECGENPNNCPADCP